MELEPAVVYRSRLLAAMTEVCVKVELVVEREEITQLLSLEEYPLFMTRKVSVCLHTSTT